MDLRVATQTVRMLAVDKLREAILSGVFKPGDRLVEAELCVRLGISRPSVREALRSLEAERLVVITPNKGPSIPVLSLEQAKEIYDVRVLIEGEAAALFSQRAIPEALAAMRRALDLFDAAVKAADLPGQVQATRTFYDIMLDGCGNSVIQEVLRSLMARITFLRTKSMSKGGRATKSAREMRAMLKAISGRNADAARAAAAAHVRCACAAVTAVYSAESMEKGRSAA